MQLTYESLAAVSSLTARVDAADWKSYMLQIASAPANCRVRVMQQLAASGVAPFGTIRRKFYAYNGGTRQKGCGEVALVDRRRVRQMTAANPWLECYMTYVENDRNTAIGGYRQMMSDFRRGRPMVGTVGTWREVWMRERPGEPVPAECPMDWTPHGATYANLQAVAKANPNYRFNIASNRRGRKAAAAYLLPVLTTRVGLPVLAKVEYDDVWHNTDIMLGAKVCQPLEFAGYDVASGFKCSSILKPRFERADGKRDNLKEQQFRFLFALEQYLNVYQVERQIRAIPGMGELIKISRSGILSEQVHAGLFIGNGGGNFKMKALCEGAHNILHNRAAGLIGSRGRDAEHLHESQAALVKYEERLMAAAARLPEEFALKLESGLLTFDEYHAAFRQIEDALMRDPEHKLEGWDGKVVQEWRLASTSNDWRPRSELVAMAKEDPDGARALAAWVGRNPALRRVRPMSRWEAYRAGVEGGEIVKVDDWWLPHFMDIEKDAIEVRVRDNGLIGFRNELLYGRDEMLYRAAVKNRAGWQQAMSPGAKALALYNPMMPEKIWLVDGGDGHTLGTCALYNRAPAYDRHAIEVKMGEQAHDLASKVLPIRGRHQSEAEERAARMANNLRVIKEASGISSPADSTPFGRGSVAAGEGYSFAELAGANDDFSPAASTPFGRGSEAAGEEAFSLDELASV